MAGEEQTPFLASNSVVVFGKRHNKFGPSQMAIPAVPGRGHQRASKNRRRLRATQGPIYGDTC